jgi:hypothetical protein
LRVYSELLYVFGNAKHGEKIGGKEVDVFLPNFNIAVEIDGSYWHKQKESQDREKTEFLKRAGIVTIRMREHPLTKLSDFDVVYANADTCLDSLSSIVQLVEIIGKLCGVDYSWYKRIGKFVNNDLYLACIQCLSVKQGRSLTDKFPDIAKMWHPKKNGILTPKKISYGSKFNAWWICNNRHEWQRRVNDCSSRKRNTCPYCT